MIDIKIITEYLNRKKDCVIPSRQYLENNNINLLYKIRNWEERYHPDILKKGEFYFARPFELNDPFDVHRPLKLIKINLDTEEFFKKLVKFELVINLKSLEEAIRAANSRLLIIKNNPEKYFLTNYLQMINSDYYNNRIGILSLTTNPENEQLWGYYGGGLKGFAVGFDAYSIILDMKQIFKKVQYGNNFNFEIIPEFDVCDLFFEKSKNWEFESEFRFLWLEPNYKRTIPFSSNSLKEIIFGPRITIVNKQSILRIVRDKYSHIKLFQLEPDYILGKINKIEFSL